MRSVSLPWPWLALLLLAVAFSFAQGLRLAAERQGHLEPAPVQGRLTISCQTVDSSAELTVSAGENGGVLWIERECANRLRLALVQVFPERTLLRWIEPQPESRSLSLPLEGLAPGRYALVALGAEAVGGPQEMDRPPEELDQRARFVLQPSRK